MHAKHPIGVFDSGYGGLTILKDIKKILPQYDYIYLGDNARAPYGTRSFETVYEYTLQAVKWFFAQGCPLVILACNTASAKALRTIQQNDLPGIDREKRVLGIVRPTSEVIGNYSEHKKIGVLATRGTVNSESYLIEINKFFPEVKVTQKACPIWVPLVEYGEYDNEGTYFFVNKYVEELLQIDSGIDTILLACTHYPILKEMIEKAAGDNVRVIAQGEIVAHSLKDYLHRHPEMESKLSINGTLDFYTTDEEEGFTRQAAIFYGESFKAKQVHLG